jgi:hypothetical protein
LLRAYGLYRELSMPAAVGLAERLGLPNPHGEARL